MTRRRTAREPIGEGKYTAEVTIELIDTEESWSPTISLGDAQKLETVRRALRRGDVTEAAKYARVFD